MDKNRIAGAAHEAKGAVKEAIGKAVGNARLQADGRTERAQGKVKAAIAGAKDAARDPLTK